MPGKNRIKQMQDKRNRKQREMDKPGGNSNYARKKNYLAREGGWGFEYAEPKPWK